MRRKLASAILIFSIFVSAGLCSSFFVSGCTFTPLGFGVIPNIGVGPLPILTGAWIGFWHDTVFNVTGSIRINVEQDTSFEVSGNIGLQNLGLSDEPGSASGTITGNMIIIQFNSPTVGSGNIKITASSVTGSGSVGLPLGFGAFAGAATILEAVINGTFSFTNPGGGAGVVQLDRVE